MKMEFEYIEKLVELVSRNALTELSIEDGEKAVVIRKEKELVTTHTAVTATAPAPIVPHAPAQLQAQPAEKPKTEEEPSNLIKITSPMVGTFYKASSPGSAPFAEVGKSITAGQVVCIIEAMKLMNEIESEVSGKVVKVCVEDGQPVEFGETLMLIEP